MIVKNQPIEANELFWKILINQETSKNV